MHHGIVDVAFADKGISPHPIRIETCDRRIDVTNEQFDIIAEKTKVFNERIGHAITSQATEKQRADEFTLIREFETVPYDGMSFEIDKGQSFRFELKDGNQILDVLLINRDNPMEEYASQYHSGTVQGPAPYQGYTFVSSPPFFRPMATIIRDTVEQERLDAIMEEGGRHMFYFNNYRCSSSTVEFATGVVNPNNCDSNFRKVLHALGGDEMVLAHRHGEAFCFFQPNKWELNDGLPIMKFYESNGCFRRGDYIELLAQQDLTVIVSSCPQGGQTNLRDMSQNTCWPVAVKVYDTGLDLPDVEPLKSELTLEFVKQGRPNMFVREPRTPGGQDSFEAEAKERGE